MLILLDFCRLTNCRFPDVVRISRNGRKPRFTLQTVLKTYQRPARSARSANIVQECYAEGCNLEEIFEHC